MYVELPTHCHPLPNGTLGGASALCFVKHSWFGAHVETELCYTQQDYKKTGYYGIYRQYAVQKYLQV
jgi:hypothetical protein